MKKKIMLVEDDQFLVRVYKKKLEDIGYIVHVCQDPLLLMDKLVEISPDLIMLDLILPGSDGFKILNEIMNNVQTREIPVVVVSDLSTSEDISTLKELGVSDYFIKSESSFNEVAFSIQSRLD